MKDLEITKQLQQLEEELLRADVRHDPRRLSALIAEDFREFGTSGRVFDKASILAELAKEDTAELSLTGFACQQISPDAALVTYRSQRTDAIGTRHALRSSLWIYRNQRWQIVFHQGTRT